MEGKRTIELSDKFVEGTGAAKFTYTEDREGLFWYIYCDAAVTKTGVDIAGATHIIFDIYISDASAWNIVDGGAGMNVRSVGSDGWISDCTQVTDKALQEAFASLKTGWNHVVLPLEEVLKTDAWAIRMYSASSTAPAGFFTILDDVRFVNEAYLNSAVYSDTVLAKNIAAQIDELCQDSEEKEVIRVKEAYDALDESVKERVANTAKLEALIQELTAEPLDIPFRGLDTGARTAQEGVNSTYITANRLEGSGATVFEHAAPREGGLFWYLYCDNEVNATGVDITGATYITFDLFISDLSAWTIGNGDARVAVRSVAGSGWNPDCTQVSADEVKKAFSNLKKGWNHIVLPLSETPKADAWAVRIYVASATAQQGFYTILDDVRFVNKPYLESQKYADVLAAKAVAMQIDQLTEKSSAAELSKARAAVNGLTENQKKLLCNEDLLVTLETEGRLLKPQTFSPVPQDRMHPLSGEPGEFAIAAISDLHYACNYSGQQQDVYYHAMRWIADNAAKENIQMAVQLGDMTSGNRLAQWQIARKGYDILKDAEVPYTAVIGNHDYGNGKSSGAYNTFLPYQSESRANPHFAGAKEEGKMENSYYCFTAGQVKYMLLTLECYPSAETIAWADQVVKEHADYNVILCTHSYLMEKGGKITYTEETEALAAGFQGKSLWEGLVKNNPNVFLTLSAHNFNDAEIGLMIDTNDAGKKVYQFLVPDPQNFEAQYGAMGFVFLLRFKNHGTTVSCEYLSTRYHKAFGTAGNIDIPVESLVYDDAALTSFAAETDRLIGQIGTVDESSGQLLERAHASFAALPQGAKQLVQLSGQLQAADAAYSVAQKVAALPAPDALTQKELENVAQAKTDYDNLTEAAKSALAQGVSDTLDALCLAAEKLAVNWGDLNGDGTIDSDDALTVLRSCVGLEELTEEQKRVADVDATGTIDSQDALFILQKSVGLAERFPAEEK